MADSIYGIRSLQLFELLSAPLVAMVQADAQAARATLEFIQAVGLVEPKEGTEAGEGDTQAGRLRMAQIRYQKLDENNQVAEFVASVPLLSLVPIPSLQIKDAKVALTAKITDIAEEKAAPAAPAAPAAVAPAVASTSLATSLKARPLRVLAKPVSASGAKNQEVRGSYDLEVEISLGQADVPMGMERVFQLMDQAIQDKKTPTPE
jgi:hypothetical protein